MPAESTEEGPREETQGDESVSSFTALKEWQRALRACFGPGGAIHCGPAVFLPFAAEPRIPFPAVVVLDELVGLRAVCRFHATVIPFEFLTHPIGHIAEVDRFGKRPGILEAAGRAPSRADGFYPLAVMSPGILDEGPGRGMVWE